MDTLIQDVRHTLRQWKRTPIFAVTAIATVALASGGTTTMMSVVDGVLLRSLPGIQRPGEVVEIRVGDRSGRRGVAMPYATFRTLRDADNGLSGLAAVGYSEVSIAGNDGAPAQIRGAMSVSGDYFTILGTRATLGRFFSKEEGRDDAARPVTVLSYAFWQTRFHGDPSVLGQTVRVNRVPLTIVGVAQEGFHGHLPLHDFSLWVPLGLAETLTQQPPEEYRFLTVGRVARGSSPARVRSAAETVASELRQEDPARWASASFLVERHTQAYQEFRGPITLFLGFLLGLSGCVLLIAGSNLGGVLFAQAITRSRELAVRLAVGAGRGRLIRQLLTEVSLLFLAGGGMGLILAEWATGALGRIPIPREIPLTTDFGPDARIMVASVVLTLAVGLIFGLPPALRAARENPGTALRENAGPTPGRQRMWRVFVVAQVAGAVILLGACGVLYRALQRVGSQDLGFQPRGAHVASVNLGVQQLGEEEGRLFFQELLLRASDLPGVESAALADFVFLVSPPQRSAVFSGPAGGSRVEAGLLGVSPEFFETAEVEILEGRAFDATDVAGGEPVAIVNETVARMLWGDDDPIGKLLTSGDQSLRVVGVAETSKYIAVGESPLAAVFRPHTQHYVPKTSLVLRVRDGYPSVAREVERLVRSIDPEVPLSRNAPYDQLVGIHLLPRRLAGGFAGVLGGVALLLASVGLYGVLTQMVTQRKGELAIRMALGAEPRRLRRPVLWRGMAMVLAGLGLGIPVALAASNLMQVFLFGLDPADPLTFGSVTLVFILVGLGASYRPAMQATRTDPARILRQG